MVFENGQAIRIDEVYKKENGKCLIFCGKESLIKI